MVARLASIAQRYQKVAGSSPAVVISHSAMSFLLIYLTSTSVFLHLCIFVCGAKDLIIQQSADG